MLVHMPKSMRLSRPKMSCAIGRGDNPQAYARDIIFLADRFHPFYRIAADKLSCGGRAGDEGTSLKGQTEHERL